jgi:hypothetical protein
MKMSCRDVLALKQVLAHQKEVIRKHFTRGGFMCMDEQETFWKFEDLERQANLIIDDLDHDDVGLDSWD